jgi:hypothetical protein
MRFSRNGFEIFLTAEDRLEKLRQNDRRPLWPNRLYGG